jgi:hypothetical protein
MHQIGSEHRRSFLWRWADGRALSLDKSSVVNMSLSELGRGCPWLVREQLPAIRRITGSQTVVHMSGAIWSISCVNKAERQAGRMG